MLLADNEKWKASKRFLMMTVRNEDCIMKLYNTSQSVFGVYCVEYTELAKSLMPGSETQIKDYYVLLCDKYEMDLLKHIVSSMMRYTLMDLKRE